MNETIEDGVREGWIIKLPVPVGHRQLRGDDHRAAAEAVVEDFEEIAPPRRMMPGSSLVADNSETTLNNCSTVE